VLRLRGVAHRAVRSSTAGAHAGSIASEVKAIEELPELVPVRVERLERFAKGPGAGTPITGLRSPGPLPLHLHVGPWPGKSMLLGLSSRLCRNRDWHLQDLRIIPQPTPLLTLACLASLEHLPSYQGVSMHGCDTPGEPRGAHHAEVPPDLLGGVPHQAPEASAPQPVENMEGVQEEHETHEGQAAQQAPSPQRARQGHTNGHSVMLSPCTVCGGVDRWQDRGVLRCVACWPKAMC
jgi:hypothetical protein